MDSYEEHQIRKYYEEKADGKGQCASSDQREDVPGQLRPDFRQEAVTEQGVTEAPMNSNSPASRVGDDGGKVAAAMDKQYQHNADTPSLQYALKPRFQMVEYVINEALLAALDYFASHPYNPDPAKQVAFIYTNPKTGYQNTWPVERACALAHEALSQEGLAYLRLMTLQAGMRHYGGERLYEKIMGEKLPY